MKGWTNREESMLETKKVASEKLQKKQKGGDTPERKGENYMRVVNFTRLCTYIIQLTAQRFPFAFGKSLPDLGPD